MGKGMSTYSGHSGGFGNAKDKDGKPYTVETIGWWPTCDCYRTKNRRKRAQQDALQERYDLFIDMADDDEIGPNIRAIVGQAAEQIRSYTWQYRVRRAEAPTIPATVFDPFVGSGTTLLVARKLSRHGIGLDLSFPYLRDQARPRLSLNALDEWEEGKTVEGAAWRDTPLFKAIQ
jgi:hypothetical protein